MRTPANLKKRAITSVVLIAAMAVILFGDSYFDRNKPFLAFFMAALGLAASLEIVLLFPVGKPRLIIILPAISLIILHRWWHLWSLPSKESYDFLISREAMGPSVLQIIFILMIIAVFIEIVQFTQSGQCIQRIANTLLTILYIGLPPLFLMQIRYIENLSGTLALAATIFVPKLGDVGAYLTGSLIGKHKMTPTLSPKKTWEGFIGGMIVSVLTAIAINFIGPEPLFKNGVPEAIAFGLIVGLAGVFGDLFESMLKRDGQTKDASQSVPGFGGVLDVVDSVLFAAPVAYLFFVL